MIANKKKPSKMAVIIYVVVLMLLLGGLVAIVSIFNAKQYSLNVSYLDGEAFSNNNCVYLKEGQEASFKVEYSDNDGEPMNEDFTVKIVPANANDAEVTYKLGENIKNYYFSEIDNFNSYFSLKKSENGFSIVAPKDFSVENAIKNANPEKEANITSEVNLTAIHFKVEIVSFDGEKKAEVFFDKYFNVEDIETVPDVKFGGIRS
jgi:hypothetical protein